MQCSVVCVALPLLLIRNCFSRPVRPLLPIRISQTNSQPPPFPVQEPSPKRTYSSILEQTFCDHFHYMPLCRKYNKSIYNLCTQISEETGKSVPLLSTRILWRCGFIADNQQKLLFRNFDSWLSYVRRRWGNKKRNVAVNLRKKHPNRYPKDPIRYEKGIFDNLKHRKYIPKHHTLMTPREMIIDQKRGDTAYLKWGGGKLARHNLTSEILPCGLIPAYHWELLKLYGKISVPVAPYLAEQLEPRLFLPRLFRGRYEIDENMFKYRIEQEWDFLMPRTESFIEDAEISWQCWMHLRNLTTCPEFGYVIKGFRQRYFPENEIRISEVVRRVNKEINEQGVHPAVLQTFWNFMTPRETLTYESAEDALMAMAPGQDVGHAKISPRTFYNLLKERIIAALQDYNMTAYTAYHNTVIEEEEYLRKRIAANEEWKRKYQIRGSVSARALGQMERTYKTTVADIIRKEPLNFDFLEPEDKAERNRVFGEIKREETLRAILSTNATTS